MAEDIATIFPNLKDRLQLSMKYRDVRKAKVATIWDLVSKSFRQRKSANHDLVSTADQSPEQQLLNWDNLKQGKKKAFVRDTLEARRAYVSSGATIGQVLERYPFLKTVEGILCEQKAMIGKSNLKFVTMRLDRLAKKHPGNVK